MCNEARLNGTVIPCTDPSIKIDNPEFELQVMAKLRQTWPRSNGNLTFHFLVPSMTYASMSVPSYVATKPRPEGFCAPELLIEKLTIVTF